MSNLQNRSLFQAVLETAHQSLLSQSVRTYSLAQCLAPLLMFVSTARAPLLQL